MGSNLNRYKSGEKHNNMTLIGLHKKKIGGNLWNVRCDCGKTIICTANDVRSGHTKSCGCMKSEWLKDARTIHGMESSREYSVWLKMRGRCLNKKDPKYPIYSGRGISICIQWNNFQEFYKDMGPRPQNTSIDRINNNGNYEPLNCRWASPLIQSNNRSFNKNVILYGEKLSCTQAAKKLRIYPTSIFQRARDFSETNQQSCDHFTRKNAMNSVAKCKSIIEKTIQGIAA